MEKTLIRQALEEARKLQITKPTRINAIIITKLEEALLWERERDAEQMWLR